MLVDQKVFDNGYRLIPNTIYNRTKEIIPRLGAVYLDLAKITVLTFLILFVQT